MTGLIILVIVAVVVIFLLVGIYNRLVALRQRANQAFSDIDVQLRPVRLLWSEFDQCRPAYRNHRPGCRPRPHRPHRQPGAA